MPQERRYARTIMLWAILTAAVLDGGCGDIPIPLPPPEGHQYLVNLGQWDCESPEEVRQTHDPLVTDKLGFPPEEVSNRIGDEIDQVGAWYDKWLELLQTALAHSVVHYPVTYRSRDANGRPITLTGMLYLPRPGLFEWRRRSVSLIAYPHGTELERDRVPSRNRGDEWVFGAAGALFGGFAVAMPDLPGMGGADPNAYHPYCHEKSLAYAVTDMIRAVNEAFDWELSLRYQWDGRLYILGYSEGGYAAMATVKELQLNADRYPGLRLTGSACMAGPFDLTGAMRHMMLDRDLHFARPFFLPYMILGYHAVYPDGPFDPNASINSLLLPDLVTWMDGSLTGDDADTLIEQRMGVGAGQVNPRSMMNASWVAQQLEDAVYETSEVGRILTANNLWSGWFPERPMLMMASPDDDCVPYANSEMTYNTFKAAGAGDWLRFHPIGRPGQGITHVGGAVIGIPSAIWWFKNECPRD